MTTLLVASAVLILAIVAGNALARLFNDFESLETIMRSFALSSAAGQFVFRAALFLELIYAWAATVALCITPQLTRAMLFCSVGCPLILSLVGTATIVKTGTCSCGFGMNQKARAGSVRGKALLLAKMALRNVSIFGIVALALNSVRLGGSVSMTNVALICEVLVVAPILLWGVPRVRAAHKSATYTEGRRIEHLSRLHG